MAILNKYIGVSQPAKFEEKNLGSYSKLFGLEITFSDEGAAGPGLYFIPKHNGSTFGMKLSPSGVITTFSVLYGTSSSAYCSVIDQNKTIHTLVNSSYMQTIDNDGNISSYPLTLADPTDVWYGGCLDSTGSIILAPYYANHPVYKITNTGVQSTFYLANTTSTYKYNSCALDSTGSVHMIPAKSPIGQKITSSGVCEVFSYPVYAYIEDPSFYGGVLGDNGNFYYMGCEVRQSMYYDISGTGHSINMPLYHTTDIPYTDYQWCGGALDSLGYVHFGPLVSMGSSRGMKIDSTGHCSTYSSLGGNPCAFIGIISDANRDMHFIPNNLSLTHGYKMNASQVLTSYPIPGGGFGHAVLRT